MSPIDDLFEARGWEDAFYPKARLLVWENFAYPGLLIDPAPGGKLFSVLAGDPLRKVKRVTGFDDAAAAIDFCERIAALTDWPQAPDWAAPPAGLDEQLHAIALEVASLAR